MEIIVTHCPENWYDLIATAARVSHNSSGNAEQNRALVAKLINMGHLSPLRHATLQLVVKDISRSCGRQLLRHKFLDYVELSQRYVDVRTMGYTIPNSLIDTNFVNVIDTVKEKYSNLVDNGIPKEDARFLLPESTHTSFVISGSFQAWFDFLKLRCEKHAQWEINDLAWMIQQQLEMIAPEVFSRAAFISWIDGVHKRIHETFEVD